jgi:magnesium chelatase family protein
MRSGGRGESSAQVRERVIGAREAQLQRAGRANALLQGRDLERDCALDAAGERLLLGAIERLGLSARAYHRVLRLARTIADLGRSRQITQAHVAEAIGYRRLDRQSQGSGQGAF